MDRPAMHATQVYSMLLPRHPFAKKDEWGHEPGIFRNVAYLTSSYSEVSWTSFLPPLLCVGTACTRGRIFSRHSL
jgi:hypothetical protein